MARTNRARVQVRLIFRHYKVCLKLARVMRLLDAQRLGVLYNFFLFFPLNTKEAIISACRDRNSII